MPEMVALFLSGSDEVEAQSLMRAKAKRLRLQRMTFLRLNGQNETV